MLQTIRYKDRFVGLNKTLGWSKKYTLLGNYAIDWTLWFDDMGVCFVQEDNSPIFVWAAVTGKEKSDIVIGGKINEIGIVAVVLEFCQYFKVIGLGSYIFWQRPEFLFEQPQCQNSRPQCPSVCGRDLKTLYRSIQVSPR